MKRLILTFLLVASLAYGGGALTAAAHRRNNSVFTPLSIAGCQLWLDASQLVGLSNNDPLSTWTDFSTHGHNATQSGGARPTYKTNVQNGQPAILFSLASSQYMTGSLTLSQPMTMFAVVQHVGGTNYQFYLDGDTHRIAFVRDPTGSPGYEVFAGSDAKASVSIDSNWHYLAGIANGASSVVSVDGSATTGLDCGADSLGATYYLGVNAAVTAFTDGYIAEFIIYDTALSAPNRVLVENYLKAKYGL